MNLYLLTHIAFSILSYSAFFLSFLSAGLFIILDREIRYKHIGMLFDEIPPLKLLERLNFIAIVSGFILLTLGLTSGIIWSGRSFGIFWRNDAKEVWSMITWLTYLILFLLRTNSSLKGRKMAILSILGFGLAIFTFLGVNYLLPTWHAYL